MFIPPMVRRPAVSRSVALVLLMVIASTVLVPFSLMV